MLVNLSRTQRNTPGIQPRMTPSTVKSRLDIVALPIFEVARVLVRFDHIARCIVNANHGAM